MKGKRKYFCQLSRKIVERAQMKRKGVNKYPKAGTIGKGVLNCGKLGNNGVKCGKKDECSKSCAVSLPCLGKAALHNYENFRKSSVPCRVMYFWSGVWNDFSPDPTNSLKEAFTAGMPSVEIVIDGSPYLVDFLRMLQVDLRAGCQRSIAWIDKNGSCFFPKVVLDDNFDEEEVSSKVEVEIEIRLSPTEASGTKRCGLLDKKGPEISEVSKTKEDCDSSNSETSKAEKRGLTMSLEGMSNVVTLKSLCKVACMNEPEPYQLTGKSPTKVLTCANELDKREEISSDEVGDSAPDCSSQSESKQCSNSVVVPVFEHLGDKLIKLREWDEEFVAVQNKFLEGLSKIELATTITRIYRNSQASALGQARLQAFHKQIEITRNSRGNPNVRYAWHGTSDICVSSIIVHGFSHSRVLGDGPAYGVGVYLASEDCSYLSVPFSRVDKNNEQHMLLCRVILGNVEEVPLGSYQFYPSCEQFDSGVDDLTSPKYHIVWSTHMNTHILPEYVISFKAPHRFHGCWGGPKANPVPFDWEGDQHSVYEPMPRKESVGVASLANMSFLKLLSIMRKHLPTASVTSLEHLYNEYKIGRIGKDIFIRRVRMIAGDNLLLSVIRGVRGQKGPVRLGRAESAAQASQLAVLMDKSVLDLQSSSKHEFVLDRQSIQGKKDLYLKMSGHM